MSRVLEPQLSFADLELRSLGLQLDIPVNGNRHSVGMWIRIPDGWESRFR